jgi:hypothetical protein
MITELLKQTFPQEVTGEKTPYRIGGSIESGSGFYLKSVWDPNYTSSLHAGYLNEKDEGTESGWMYTVNNVFPGDGADDVTLNDGDVVRWQYTKVGLGADIGNTSLGAVNPITVANKDALTAKIAEICKGGTESNYPTYNAALAALTNLASTQDEVNAALDALNAAPEQSSNAQAVATTKQTVETAKSAWVTTSNNDAESIRAWLQGQVDALNLGDGVTATVTVNYVTTATNGTQQAKSGAAGSFAATVTLTKGSGHTLATDSVSVSGTITPTAFISSDATAKVLSVDGTAGTINGTTVTVVLPFGSTISDSLTVVVETTDTDAICTQPTTNNGGVTWTFIVTAENGDKQGYTVNVSIAANPAAGNIADVSTAKSTIENSNWTVAITTANDESAITGYIQSQLDSFNLNGVTATLGSVSVAPAVAGAAGSSATWSGTQGSFAATVTLSKGADETLAEVTATISGTIT